MAISKKVETYLKKMNIKADIISHKTVYTVYDLAQTMKQKFDSISKTLLIKADKDFFLVVMPANYRLDVQKFKKSFKVKKVSLATEKDMKNKFHTKPGAMLPFGALHKLEVIMDTSLLKTKDAFFQAGSFTDSIRMKVKDYVHAVEPTILSIAKRVPMKLQVVKTKPKAKKRVAKKKPASKRGKKKITRKKK